MSDYLTISELAAELGVSEEKALTLARELGLKGLIRLSSREFLGPTSLLDQLRKTA